MAFRHRTALALFAALGFCSPAATEPFVFHGRLDEHGTAANGHYDLRLTLFAEATSPSPLAGPMTFSSVAIRAGRFAVDADFGELPGFSQGWLEVAARSADDSDFIVVDRRVVSLKAGQCPLNWTLEGNAGTDPQLHFLGTVDTAGFEIRVGNAPSLRIEPSSETQDQLPITANVIAGSRANTVATAVRGATVAGGGVMIGADPIFVSIPGDTANRVLGNYGFVGGGAGNSAEGIGSAVGGGLFNAATSSGSAGAFVGAGIQNTAGGQVAFIGAGSGNTALGTGAVIVGGKDNRAAGADSAIVGGNANAASGQNASIGGGFRNCAGAADSWAGGHQAKVRPAIDPNDNSACDNLFILGDAFPAYPGGSGDVGSFVWSSQPGASLGESFVSTGPNQFLVRAVGGVGINTNLIPENVDMVVSTPRIGNDFVTQNVDLFLRPARRLTGINLSVLDLGFNQLPAFEITRYTHNADGSPVGGEVLLRLDQDKSLTVFANAIKPGGGAWAALSDLRLKRKLRPLQNSLERLLSLRGVSFEYSEDAPMPHAGGRHDGFVAQEVQKVFPHWVHEDDTGYLNVAVQGFEALTVEALRELRFSSQDADRMLDQRITALEVENATLQEALSELTRRLHALEQRR